MTARILVVDDLQPNIKLLEAKLSNEYFEVCTASDGTSALDEIEKNAPDIVLLDVMMPGMDGFEVCKRIRSNSKTMHIPIIMVTALSSVSDRNRGLEAGADDFLTKPVNDVAMFARIRSLVRLKMLTDEWLSREKTSNLLGVFRDNKTISSVGYDDANILVIEDNKVDHLKIISTLKKDSANIISTTNLDEAKEILKDKSFELIIINLRLRNQNALRFCSRIRANDETRTTPILMVAEEEDTKQLAKGLDLGINDYLIKPIDRNELEARSRTQIRRQRYQERLRNNYQHSLQMALIDSLTGLYNRRYMEAHLSTIIERQSVSGKNLSLMTFDIDNFKQVNDTYGHQAGDEVLINLSSQISDNVRNIDTIARMGGEEFVIVMPDTDRAVGFSVAERLRETVENILFIFPEKPEGINITISIGLTLMNAYEATDTLLKRADLALYKAKNNGKNQVIITD